MVLGYGKPLGRIKISSSRISFLVDNGWRVRFWKY